MTAAIDNQAAAFILLGADKIIGLLLVGGAAFWLSFHYASEWFTLRRSQRALDLRLDEATETVEFTAAADEAIALTLPVVEPNVFDDMVRKLPIEQAVYLMPGALGDEVEAWLREGAAS